MNTPTPRTDSRRITATDNDTCKIKVLETVHASFARTLERELAALRAERDQLRAELAKERARLDWLEKSDPDALHWWTVGEPNSIRVDIDAAMKEEAK